MMETVLVKLQKKGRPKHLSLQNQAIFLLNLCFMILYLKKNSLTNLKHIHTFAKLSGLSLLLRKLSF